MRIAWFSPLDGVTADGDATTSRVVPEGVAGGRLGIGRTAMLSAFASRTVLPVLLEKASFTLFSDTPGRWGEIPVYHYLDAFRHHAHEPFDIFFYQVEDHFDARWTRQVLALHPGIVWFHDVLFTVPPADAVAVAPWRGVLRAFHSSMKPGEVLFPPREWWREFRDEEHFYRGDQKDPFGWRELSYSVSALFSQPWALAEYRRRAEDTNNELLTPAKLGVLGCVPLPLTPEMVTMSPYGAEKAQSLTLAFCGRPRIESRAHKLLRAMRDTTLRLLWLVDADESVRAMELVQEFNLTNVHLRIGRTPEAWLAAVKESHCAAHLHYSVYGNLDPYLSISLAQGVPTLVSDFGMGALLSDALVVKIPPGAQEVATLTRALHEFSTNELLFQWRHAVETSGVLRTHLHASKIAHELMLAMEKAVGSCRAHNECWQKFTVHAEHAVQARLRDRNARRFAVFGEEVSSGGYDAQVLRQEELPR